MRITFVLPHANLAGGVRVVAIYAERLQRRGHEVFVISWPRKPPRRLSQIKALLLNEPCREPRHETSYFDPLFYVPHRILETRRPVRDDDVPDADVIVATWWETAEWVAALSPRKGAKVYFIQHHEVFDYLPKDRVAATYSLPLHKITISRWLVDLMRDTYGDKHVSLVFNSVDTRQFFAQPRQRQAAPTVGLLYSSLYWKGCDLSLQAVANAKAVVPNLRIIAFGSEPISPALPLPPGSVYFHSPAQSAIKDIYAMCDVWLCGSRAEGFHLPPLEAMACRCPVVSTAVGGPIDVIRQGQNGFTVPIGDVRNLSARLIEILGFSDQAWGAMSSQAHETATRYTWDDATELFEQALHAGSQRSR